MAYISTAGDTLANSLERERRTLSRVANRVLFAKIGEGGPPVTWTHQTQGWMGVFRPLCTRQIKDAQWGARPQYRDCCFCFSGRKVEEVERGKCRIQSTLRETALM